MTYPDDYIDKVICGEALETMCPISDNSIDMVLCDLPYGITQNKWDSVIDLNALWTHYKAICKENAAIVLTASQPFASALVMSNPEWFRHEWIWIKNRGGNFANTVREPFKEHEQVLVFSKGGWTYCKQMQERTGGGIDRTKYDFNRITKTKNYGKFDKLPERLGRLRGPSSWQKFNVECGLHPTQKPVPLFEYLIKTYSNEGDIVLDNCIGSGTTAIAALRTGRRYIGIEQSKEYVDIARERIRMENNQLKLPL